MPRSKSRSKWMRRGSKPGLAETAVFPRLVIAASVLWIGLMLVLGAIAAPDGTLRKPGLGSYLCAGAVLAAAAGVTRADPCLRAAKDLLSRFSRSRNESR
ncbi:MAG TPA: hypothetical protein VMB25_03705 [Bryobacteraceae bacterium]|nr:hypothetical protein [Bryobacteraceae bacterium]